MTALDLLVELEKGLAEDPSAADTPDEGEPSPREWRLWLVERLMGEDIELHLLAYHLLGVVAEPKPGAVSEWLADLAAAVQEPCEEESASEVRRLLLGVSRLLLRPVEVRTAAADVLMALSGELEGEDVLLINELIDTLERPTVDGILDFIRAIEDRIRERLEVEP